MKKQYVIGMFVLCAGLLYMPSVHAQITDTVCDITTDCGKGFACISFPEIGLRCANPNNIPSYFQCPSGTQLQILEMYPLSVQCWKPCQGQECAQGNQTVSYVPSPSAYQLFFQKITDVLKGFQKRDTVKKDPILVFEKKEGWGPCMEGLVCEQTTKLYDNGKFIVERNHPVERQLNKQTMKKILNKIRKSRILHKNCSTNSIVLDYGATYNIQLDGKMQSITFPGCEKELKEVEKLLPLIPMKG